MERDLFRFVSGSESGVPPEQVRGASTLEQQGIGIHAERLVSEADGSGAWPLRLTPAHEERRIRRAKVKELVTRPLDWEFVRGICNYFFGRCLEDEEHRFDSLYAGLNWRRWLAPRRLPAAANRTLLSLRVAVGRHAAARGEPLYSRTDSRHGIVAKLVRNVHWATGAVRLADARSALEVRRAFAHESFLSRGGSVERTCEAL